MTDMHKLVFPFKDFDAPDRLRAATDEFLAAYLEACAAKGVPVVAMSVVGIVQYSEFEIRLHITPADKEI